MKKIRLFLKAVLLLMKIYVLMMIYGLKQELLK